MRNNTKHTPEKLLIDTYKHIEQARTNVDQLIDLIGSEKMFIHHLPEDIQEIIHLSLQLSQEKRALVHSFLKTLKKIDKHT